jgi:hypothetical protein
VKNWEWTSTNFQGSAWRPCRELPMNWDYKARFKLYGYKYIRVMFNIFFALCLFLSSCYAVQGSDKTAEKMPTILVNLIKADDPVSYAKGHGITLKDGMVRVIITVDKDIISQDLLSKYGLKDYQWIEDIITGYIPIDGLKELSEESAVIYIRPPVKFMRQED